MTKSLMVKNSQSICFVYGYLTVILRTPQHLTLVIIRHCLSGWYPCIGPAAEHLCKEFVLTPDPGAAREWRLQNRH